MRLVLAKAGWIVVWLAVPFIDASAEAQEEQAEDRIVNSAEVRAATLPSSLGPVRTLCWPYRKITSGMESGLIAFEQKKVLERYRDWMGRLTDHGITPKFGGMGEGSGFGGGAIYEHPITESQTIRVMGLLTFRNYQEADLQWRAREAMSTLFIESSYQWRPQENYYGEGHDSSKTAHTNFALRQSWAGVRWEVSPVRRVSFGVLSRWIWTRASEGLNAGLPPISTLFSGLAGYNSESRLNSTGAYFDIDGIRDEYSLGGAAHLGTSYQQSFSGGNLRYLNLEMRLEGRTPIKVKNSVLVGQADFQLNRERGDSDPIPFYLQPHIGGSSTLRGYPLDRFYGRNLALLTLEYRIRVHPNIQFYPFFDEGQIFNHTDDLSWLNWHRNYGFGFLVRTARSTILRTEVGWGGQGSQFHIIFGDRSQPPLRGPLRYGVYKR